MRRACPLAAVIVALALGAAAPGPLLGQTDGSVVGRVEDVATGVGVANAVVQLVGYAAVLTTADGGFRFDDVEAGPYRLRVIAFGYQDEEMEVVVEDGDVRLEIGLEIDPIPIDSLTVELRELRVEGRVSDAAAGAPIYDADVLLNGSLATRTSSRGRFSLVGPVSGVPYVLSVRVFGYLPVDTVLRPTEDGRYDFALVRDPVTDSILAQQIRRLGERRTGPPAIGMPPLTRERLMRWHGLALSDVLEGTLTNRLRRVRCVIVDEELVSPHYDTAVLRSMLPGDVERVEFLFGGGMMRVYTRTFMQDLIAGRAQLETPLYFGSVSPPLCR